jgi:hypothetical protein
MNVTYRREMKHNYLIIEPEISHYDSYEVQMMASNGIEGLLKFRLKQVDDRKLYCYEITSKQPLNRILDLGSIGAAELHSLISGIGQTLGRLESYLLSESQITLKPEFIYVEPETFTAFLCLIPGRKGDFPGEMTELLQYLLGKINHQDKSCVVMAYGLYQESLKDNYGMEDLMAVLESDVSLSYDKDKKNIPITAEQEIIYREETEVSDLYFSKDRDESDSREQSASVKGNWRNLVERLLLFMVILLGGPLLIWLFKGIEGFKDYWIWAAGLDIIAALLLLKGVVLSNKKETISIREAADNEEYEIDHDNDEEGDTPWRMIFAEDHKEEVKDCPQPEPVLQTVLLSEQTIHSAIRYLNCITSDCENIPVSYVPFIIGKQEGLVDFAIQKDTISRIHVRIDREGEEYKITDLNSTNGTKVGNVPLESNETVTLSPGDEVYIANIGFIFT